MTAFEVLTFAWWCFQAVIFFLKKKGFISSPSSFFIFIVIIFKNGIPRKFGLECKRFMFGLCLIFFFPFCDQNWAGNTELKWKHPDQNTVQTGIALLLRCCIVVSAGAALTLFGYWTWCESPSDPSRWKAEANPLPVLTMRVWARRAGN